MNLSRIRRKAIVKAAVFLSGLATILSFGFLVQAGEVREIAEEFPAELIEDTLSEEQSVIEADTLRALPIEQITFAEEGVASWYGPGFHGRRTANGEVYNKNAFTAAHKTLPFGTILRVTNQRNGKSVLVRVNDRGPFVHGRIIDLSQRAAESIGLQLCRVTIEAYLPVRKARKVPQVISESESVDVISFLADYSPVNIEGSYTTISVHSSFSEAIDEVLELRNSGIDAIFSVVQPVDEESLETAKKWIRARRGTPYYHYEVRTGNSYSVEEIAEADSNELMRN